MRSIYQRGFGYWPVILPAIMVRDVDRRFRASRMAGLMLLLEPIMLIGVVGAVQYFMRNGMPIYGPSMPLFLVSGFLPFYLFVHSSRGIGKDVSNEREFPIVNDLDLQIARLLIEVLRNLFLFCLLLTFIYFFDTTMAYPRDMASVACGLVLITGLALGLGLLTSAIITVVPVYTYVNGIVSRAFLLGSGIFSIIDHYPPWVREVVIWNPLGQCLMWIRTGFYPDYPHSALDRGYAIQVTVIFLFVGFAAFSARPVNNS